MPEAAAATNEADALADILIWSRDRPLWQCDALRRLVLAENLTEEDLTALTEICKGERGDTEPLSEEHIRVTVAGSPPVSLGGIGRAQNVNALAEDQNLSFPPTGVTIIYGDNGSGKSGYVRILKRACRARGRNEDILRNIYGPAAGPQQAEIAFTAGGQSQDFSWRGDQPAIPVLSAISVFDSATANVHVDATNDVAYTPYPMKLLERLVQACKAVKANLDAEIVAIKQQTPAFIEEPPCHPETAVGQLVSGLSNRTDPTHVEALATLSDDDKERLATLRSDLAQDPATLAGRLRGQKRDVEEIVERIAVLHDSVSDESIANLRNLRDDLDAKRRTATVAATDLFKEEPLAGIGSETWHALWEASRAYALTEAYPEQTYPVTEEGSHCVLCQQVLAPEAADRLRRFEAFVKDRTKQEEQQAAQRLAEYEGSLRSRLALVARLPSWRKLLRDHLGKVDLADTLRRHLVLTLLTLRRILRTGERPGVPASIEPLAPLAAIAQELESRAATIGADAESDARRALIAELAALEARNWLAGVKDDVIAEICRKRQIADIESAARDTRHADITRKSSDLSETLVTDRLRGRFAQEIAALKIAGLALELRKERTREGVPQFRVCLIHQPSQKVGDVLSEGEHRCVALAAFLAELSTTDNPSGIVFDDPISSLDHMHREAVAQRLADEGRKRQVIVFTHDLPFLFLLDQKCREGHPQLGPTGLAIRHVQRRGDTPGYCIGHAPNRARPASQRIESIANHLSNVSGQAETDPDGWLYAAKGILGELRDTWEAAVEEVMSPVLRTFASKVDTKGFARLSVVTIEDAEAMRSAYGRCSQKLHNASAALNPAIPTPDQIEEEIACLSRWITEIKARQAQIAVR